MPSHTECREGGSHDFSDTQEDGWLDGDIIVSCGCSKCEEVFENEVLVWDGTYDYEGCEPDTCPDSDSGHTWHDTGHEYQSPDQYFMEECDCGGKRTQWYRHKYTTYNDFDGIEFHRIAN